MDKINTLAKVSSIATLLGLLFAAHTIWEQAAPPSEPAATSQSTAKLFFQEAAYTKFDDEGQVNLHLWAQEAECMSPLNVINFTKIKITLHDRNRDKWLIRADQGNLMPLTAANSVPPKANQITVNLHRNVTVQWRALKKPLLLIETEALSFDARSQRAKILGPVKVTQGKHTAQASSAHLDLHEGTIELLPEIKYRYKL